MMVESSQSTPGQFAAAIKKASTASREGGFIPPELLGIKHGHEGGEPTPETATPPAWPDHLLPRPAETPEGGQDG
jgi:hypothetical protein